MTNIKQMRTVTITAVMICQILRRNATAVDTPEAKLWLAVLTNAIRERHDPSYRRGCATFFDSAWFATVCNLVGLDPDYVREMMDEVGRDYEVAI